MRTSFHCCLDICSVFLIPCHLSLIIYATRSAAPAIANLIPNASIGGTTPIISFIAADPQRNDKVMSY